jgi:dihydroorotase
MNLRIANGLLVDPVAGTERKADLFIAGESIASVGEAPAGFTAERTIDANGLVVCPGLVDLSARDRKSVV